MEAAGAGLTADCPICNTVVTVPRAPGGGRSGVKASVATDSSRPAFADPGPDDLRDELIDASLINGKLVRDLAKAREEIANLQQQLKTVGEECEHLNASTTHTQAELKTFQAERLQSKAELSAFRQKLATAEEALAERDEQLKKARAKASGSVSANELKAVEARLHEAGSRAAELETKAVAAENEREDAVRRGDEWKSKAEAALTGLAEAAGTVSIRESEARAAEAAAQEQREQLAAELAQKQRKHADASTRLAALDEELHKTRWRLGEVEAELAGAQETALRLTTAQVELQRQLDEATALLGEAGDLKALLARSGEEVCDRTGKLRLAEESAQTLTNRCEQLRRESDALRRDLSDSHSGREVLELRSRLDDAVTERDRTAARLSTVEADLRAFTATETAIRAELEQARSERDDALERAEALRETRAAMDNQVLRGIIARLNSDLAQRAAEVIRLKRARYGLKIAYVLFAVGFLAVVAFALTILPHALKP